MCLLYDVVIETGMPNLEENLRYATTREERCLTQEDFASIFPILKHPSLADCHLDKVTYVLACEGNHGTTGQASWRRDADRIRGTLTVKLGGKNMTLFQRVTAKRLDQAAPSPIG
jgi:hypothetical protein